MKRKIVAAFAALTLCAGTGVAAAVVGPAGINGPGLLAVGPVSSVDGFPTWYKDNTGLRLQSCIDPADAICPLPAGAVPPGTTVTFPNNYPDEAFYSRTATTPDTAWGRNAPPSSALVR